MKEVFILISEVGFPIAITLVSGFFIFLTIKYLLDSVIGQINGLQTQYSCTVNAPNLRIAKETTVMKAGWSTTMTCPSS